MSRLSLNDLPMPPRCYRIDRNANTKFETEECGSAWKRDPGSGVIGVEKGPLIPVV